MEDHRDFFSRTTIVIWFTKGRMERNNVGQNGHNNPYPTVDGPTPQRGNPFLKGPRGAVQWPMIDYYLTFCQSLFSRPTSTTLSVLTLTLPTRQCRTSCGPCPVHEGFARNIVTMIMYTIHWVIVTRLPSKYGDKQSLHHITPFEALTIYTAYSNPALCSNRPTLHHVDGHNAHLHKEGKQLCPAR